ncbi:MAG: hypothetical protein R3338_02365 [Thermoanaerobaculia bacterium]|nr:hypothetical protein [Thermoanaerobaculia bacterium]
MNDKHDDDVETSPGGTPDEGPRTSPEGDQETPVPPPLPATPEQPGGTPIPPTPPPPESEGPTKPADYYAQPPATAEPKQGCGKWLVGCGAAGCLVGILLIAGIFWFAKSGWPVMMSKMVAEVETHLDEHGEEIDPAVREELDTELAELRRHIEDGDVRLQEMEAVVYSIRDIVGDQNVTTSEAEEFLEDVKRVNEIGATEEF